MWQDYMKIKILMIRAIRNFIIDKYNFSIYHINYKRIDCIHTPSHLPPLPWWWFGEEGIGGKSWLSRKPRLRYLINWYHLKFASTGQASLIILPWRKAYKPLKIEILTEYFHHHTSLWSLTSASLEPRKFIWKYINSNK